MENQLKALTQAEENLAEAINNWHKLTRKHASENNQPDGQMNCSKQSCVFLEKPCSKHKPILKRQELVEKMAQEKMRICKIKKEQLEKDFLAESKIQVEPFKK